MAQKRQNTVGKSYSGNADNPVLQYCLSSTTPDHPVQQELLKETLATYEESRMFGAPECLALNSAIIRSKNAKKILDIGVFTGASAMASALAFTNKRCELVFILYSLTFFMFYFSNIQIILSRNTQ